MTRHNTITVEGVDIRFYQEMEEDFISLTDIARKFSDRTDQVILNWLRTRSTVDFLGAWEIIHNQLFNPLNFEGIRNRTGSPTFVLTISDWVEQTKAIGIRAKAGRYGGSYAHKDIAFEFLSYLSPTFKLYVIKEFQRLKELETKQTNQALDWNFKRTLSKMNYTVHTDAIKENLIPPRISKEAGIVYASEADVLNMAVFGMTAKTWKTSNEGLKGNIRDYATPEQLLVLSNLEAVNAELIRMKLTQDVRMDILNQAAIKHLQSLLSSPSLPKLFEPETEKQDTQLPSIE